MTQRGGGSDGRAQTLAEKLNYLFAVVLPEGETREYSGREVVAGVRAGGTDLSASHLSELRRGVKTNPTMRVLQGIADFFKIKVAYFFDDDVAEEVEAELRLRAAMRDAQVRDLAFRIAGLPQDHRTAMYRLLTDVVTEYDGSTASEAGPSADVEHGQEPDDGHPDD